MQVGSTVVDVPKEKFTKRNETSHGPNHNAESERILCTRVVEVMTSAHNSQDVRAVFKEGKDIHPDVIAQRGLEGHWSNSLVELVSPMSWEKKDYGAR